jgi:hypothetical protein
MTKKGVEHGGLTESVLDIHTITYDAINPLVVALETDNQYCGSGAFLTTESGSGISFPGSRIPNYYFGDPIFLCRKRDGRKSGSEINIPDPQHKHC